ALAVAPATVVVARPVHPHVRGAHTPTHSVRSQPGGPSPRAWGSRRFSSGIAGGGRSIPTCVGLTDAYQQLEKAESVHPHVRGAHVEGSLRLMTATGPSPRAWGSQLLTCNFARRYLLVTTLPGSAASLVPHLPTPIVEQVEARRSPQSRDDAP